jgi:P4 family phage/plasmid primase-like protien
MDGAADAASAGYIARSWPGQGVRHDYVNACTGYLGRHLPRPRTQRIMDAAIYAAGVIGADEESDRRYAPVRATLDKLERGEPVTGAPRLEDFSPGLADQLRRWHGWSTKNDPESDPRRASGEANGKVNLDAGLVKALSDAICEKDHFARDAGDRLYRFSGGTYRHFGERYIRGRVKRLLEGWGLTKRWSSHVGNEVVHYILADCPDLWDRPPDDSINVANGILEIRSGELRAHDPGYLSPVQISVRFDSQADCPAWDRFVGEVFPEDARELAYELAADLMCPGGSSQQAILLLGEGSNGKSTFLRALTGFIGSPNAAGLSLHKLESDRFATARLVGKLANICPDLPSAHLWETSIFKAITGGDTLTAECKYKDSFEFDPFCRLVFSANHVPRSEDASHAFFRRWAVIPFDRTFEPDEQTPREQLDASRLSDPDELSGVLNRALLALPRVRREGFTESDSMRAAWEEFKEMTDPVSVWLQHHTIEHAGASVPKSTLHGAFKRYCEQKERAGMTSRAFGRALGKARPKLGEAQQTVSDRRVWCWVGIGLKQGEGTGEDDRRD